MGRRIFLLAVLGGGLAGCNARELPEPEGDLFVLELGGSQQTLRGVLHLEVEEAAEPLRPKPLAQPAEHPSPRVAAPPTTSLNASPSPRAFYEVELRSGETLYALCRRELADPGRWREVMKLNGLIESDLRTLPTGKMIRFPRR